MIYGQSEHQMTTSQSLIFIFGIRPACELRLVSCESKHSLQSATMCVHTQITQKLQPEYRHSAH